MQADNVPMPDAANGFKFSLKLPQVVWRLIAESLNRNWSGIFQHTFVNCARSTIPYDILITQILSESHYIIKGMNSHIHVENY